MKIKKTISCDVETTRSYTPQGFLKVTVLAGRVGVQRYSCDELGVPDKHGTGFVSVARLPDDVFSANSLDSLEFIDVTNSHPKDREVTADNYQAETVGVVTSKGRKHDDSIHIACDALIKDKKAIRAVESGKKQASLGYEHDITERVGVLDGQSYDYIQTDIFHNHLAIVHRGRAKTATILDSELSMTEEEIKEMQDKLAKLEANETKLINDAESAELDKTIDRAKIINPKLAMDSKNSEQIKREILGSRVSNDQSIDVVNFAFNEAYLAALSGNKTHKPIGGNVSNDSEDDEKYALNEKGKYTSNDAENAALQYIKELEEGYEC